MVRLYQRILVSILLIVLGSLARIGPKHLLTSDPSTIRRILAARSGYSRGPWFDSLRIDPRSPNIVSERNMESHKRLRYKVSASVRHTERNVPHAAYSQAVLKQVSQRYGAYDRRRNNELDPSSKPIQKLSISAKEYSS